MTYETLQYVDGNGDTQEIAMQNLSENGAPVKMWMEPRSHTWGEFHIILPQPPETALAIPFLSQCVVYACRTSATGGNNSFSGGQIIFQGRRWANQAQVSAESKRMTNEILLCDALRDLKEITYQMAWQQITGGTTNNPNYSPLPNYPDVVLFSSNFGLGLLQPDGTYEPYDPIPQSLHITSWQQIQAVVNWALFYLRGTAQAVQLQLTEEPEFVPTYVPYYTARSMKCLDVLTLCLRPHPLVYTEMDYTTQPPTLHFRFVGNMTPTTLPYKSTDPNGNVHIATDITPLPELVADSVKLFYRQTTTVNGRQVVGFIFDFWPENAGPGLFDEVYSIDVSGGGLQETIKNFTSYNFDPTDLNLWRTKVPSLKEISQGGQIVNDGQQGALTILDTNPYDPVNHPKGIQVIDHKNNPVDYEDDYPFWTNESVYSWFVIPGGLPPGLYIGSGQEGVAAAAEKVTVKAFFSYTRTTTVGTGANAKTLTQTVPEHEYSMRLTLTNAPTATYSLEQATNSGESILIGLAETIYNELQWLQYKLQHENWQIGANENTPPQIIKPGKNTINLSGGLAAWETMNAVPERINIGFMRVKLNGTWLLAARHTINCGPVSHLNPAYRVQLMNLFANRLLQRINPNQPASGLAASGQTDLSADEATDSATPSLDLKTTQQIFNVDPATGKVSNIQTSTSDLSSVDTQVKLVPICAVDASGNQVSGYYAYGPQVPPT